MDILGDLLSNDTFTGLILPLLLTGAFGPALLSGICLLLGSPVLRNLVGPACRAGGLWFSVTTSNVLDRFFGTGAGERLEDALEDFQQFCTAAFWQGANADDKAAAALVKADPAVTSRLTQAVETAVRMVETVTRDQVPKPPSKAKEDAAVKHVDRDLREDMTDVAKEALKLAAETVVRRSIRGAVKRLFPH